MNLTYVMSRPRASIDPEPLKSQQSALRDEIDRADFIKFSLLKNLAVTRSFGKKPTKMILCELSTQNHFEAIQAFKQLARFKSNFRKQLITEFDNLTGQKMMQFAVLTQIQFKSHSLSSLIPVKIKSSLKFIKINLSCSWNQMISI
jgi:hypothetical protein